MCQHLAVLYQWYTLFSLSLILIYIIYRNPLLSAAIFYFSIIYIQAIFIEYIINTNIPRHSFTHLIITSKQQVILLPFYFLNICLFILEREDVCTCELGEEHRERERTLEQTPCWVWSPTWGSIPVPRDHNVSWNQEVAWYSVLLCFLLKIFVLMSFFVQYMYCYAGFLFISMKNVFLSLFQFACAFRSEMSLLYAGCRWVSHF